MKQTYFSLLLLLLAFISTAQNSRLPHLQKQGTATQLIVQGKPFLMLAGELHNSTTSDAVYMRPVWKQMKDKNLNTVIAAASWELVEKEKGRFDFALVDSMIYGARKQGLRLIILWFASWKNGGSTYMPPWVKKDVVQYPRVKDEAGKTLEILSTFGEATCAADANAFKAMMRHIRSIDEKEQTVIMMQVENEVGILNSKRDFSDVANKAFQNEIPKDVINYLSANKDRLTPELYAAWKENGFKTSGSWETVFGKGKYDKGADWKSTFYYAEELFMAYHYAKYIGRVAAAGKEAHPIPMFVNAWQKQPDYSYPGKYPSGGPLPHVMDMWHAAAPAIDMIVPDIYMPEFMWVCEQYHRLGNPLLIPETRGGALGAARALYAFGAHDAMCFSPFGIDSDYRNDVDMMESYATLNQLKELILQHQGKGTMQGILTDTMQSRQQFELGGYRIEARLQTWPAKAAIAGGIIFHIGPDEFIVAGKSMDLQFTPSLAGNLPIAAIEFADEGIFKNGKWIAGRRLNGDETHTSSFDFTGLKFPSAHYSIQHVKLYRYK